MLGTIACVIEVVIHLFRIHKYAFQRKLRDHISGDGFQSVTVAACFCEASEDFLRCSSQSQRTEVFAAEKQSNGLVQLNSGDFGRAVLHHC